MLTFAEIVAEQADMAPDDVEWLQDLVREGQIVADLSLADIAMWVRTKDKSWVAVALFRASTAMARPLPMVVPPAPGLREPAPVTMATFSVRRVLSCMEFALRILLFGREACLIFCKPKTNMACVLELYPIDVLNRVGCCIFRFWNKAIAREGFRNKASQAFKLSKFRRRH